MLQKSDHETKKKDMGRHARLAGALKAALKIRWLFSISFLNALRKFYQQRLYIGTFRGEAVISAFKRLHHTQKVLFISIMQLYINLCIGTYFIPRRQTSEHKEVGNRDIKRRTSLSTLWPWSRISVCPACTREQSRAPKDHLGWRRSTKNKSTKAPWK